MDDPDHIEENFREYLNKFSANVRDIVHDMMMDSLKIHTATYIADTYPDFKNVLTELTGRVMDVE